MIVEDDRVRTPVQIRKQVFMLCAALRCFIGVMTIQNKMPRWLLIALSSLLTYFFSLRAMGKKTWKPFAKSAYIYSSILALSIGNFENSNVAIGSLFIVDAATGLLARHIAE